MSTSVTVESIADILAFVTVVEQGTFTAAARELDMPKSSVSRRVSRLEKTLGIRLLHRTTRSNTLTSAGEIYFAQAVESIQGLNEVQNRIVGFADEPQGRLKITCPSGFVRQTGDLFQVFLDRYPKVSIQILETDRYVDLIEDGFDLAFRGGSEPNPSLEGLRIIQRPWVLGASRDYLRRRGEPDSLNSLSEHALVVLGGSRQVTWRLTGKRNTYEFKVTAAVATNNLQTLDHLVRTGVGIGLIPEGVCLEGHSKVVRLFPDVTGGQAEIWLIYPKGALSNPSLAAFFEFAESWDWSGVL
jgi:DNA-binding transcriptional LysR family regulator